MGREDAPSGTGRGGHNLGLIMPTALCLLIAAGENVKTVQSRLGHASAVETLDTYSHLWPDTENTTRSAVEAVFSKAASGCREDDLRTETPA